MTSEFLQGDLLYSFLSSQNLYQKNPFAHVNCHSDRLQSKKTTCRLCWVSLHTLYGLSSWKQCLAQASGCRGRSRPAPTTLRTWLSCVPIQLKTCYSIWITQSGFIILGITSFNHKWQWHIALSLRKIIEQEPFICYPEERHQMVLSQLS